LVTGNRGQRMLDPGIRSVFDQAFLMRRTFRRLVHGCPVWRVDQREAVLTGVAECLAHTVSTRQLQRAA